MSVLSDLTAALVDGRVDVIDLTAPLSDRTPILHLPPPFAKATLVLAIVVALVIWVVAEAVGGILAGGGTDPNSGPLLALLALSYWPFRAASAGAGAVSVPSAGAERGTAG